jgi:hypothetical protein
MLFRITKTPIPHERQEHDTLAIALFDELLTRSMAT